jgi:hypothetical protein
MRKVALLLAIVVAAASPSLALAGKAKGHHQKTVAAQPADPNANTGHLFHDLVWGKK